MRILKKILRKIYHLLAFFTIYLLFIPNVNAATAFWGNNTEEYENLNFIMCNAWNCSGTGSTLSVVSFSDGQDADSGTIRRYIMTSGSVNITSTYGAMILQNVNKYKAGYLYHSIDYFCSNGNIPTNTPVSFYAGSWSNVMNNSATPTYFSYNISSVEGQPFSTFVNSHPWSVCYQIDYLWVADNDAVMTGVKLEPTSNLSRQLYFIGHNNENLGIYTSEISNIIRNSGFATASSVNEVKTSVNEVKQEISNIDDTMNNSSVDSSDSTINNLKGQLPTNSVISDLLLLPVRLLQAIVNSLGGTCATFNLGNLYGTNLVMPCINIENYLGSAIWTFIDLVFSGMFILVIRKKFIQIFENITNLRGGGNEVD